LKAQWICNPLFHDARFSALRLLHPFDFRPQLFWPFVHALKTTVNLADVLDVRFALGTQR
jgi:hypothetical protein